MKPLALLLALVTLVACGADGEPQRPGTAETAPDTGVTISGEARFGVTRAY
ncbi:argininosuccinate lyase [Lutimaribacter sp. EGI FJ00015]|uniref:Argininosuccinate lyase n=1 Tax=Lutimaribacter degradans TaxID=2945989 RepID=A0ACC5ZYL5_9RHOB|nr:argininosuccinate lyase [Lutimaribacter sp. EGI FJ00013]MCM2563013.1 argininosuccinate lyase [Lutimaribacter sp. EGI FJ00013]MCO0614181.1 argininosuccinate lyase [Lutimaribacter sp. EGI FJ00015]MCO0636158.1 argininosuccinate lyase [Lutimaribacter sp. EGI FJ00014]